MLTDRRGREGDALTGLRAAGPQPRPPADRRHADRRLGRRRRDRRAAPAPAVVAPLHQDRRGRRPPAGALQAALGRRSPSVRRSSRSSLSGLLWWRSVRSGEAEAVADSLPSRAVAVAVAIAILARRPPPAQAAAVPRPAPDAARPRAGPALAGRAGVDGAAGLRGRVGRRRQQLQPGARLRRGARARRAGRRRAADRARGRPAGVEQRHRRVARRARALPVPARLRPPPGADARSSAWSSAPASSPSSSYLLEVARGDALLGIIDDFPDQADLIQDVALVLAAHRDRADALDGLAGHRRRLRPVLDRRAPGRRRAGPPAAAGRPVPPAAAPARPARPLLAVHRRRRRPLRPGQRLAVQRAHGGPPGRPGPGQGDARARLRAQVGADRHHPPSPA